MDSAFRPPVTSHPYHPAALRRHAWAVALWAIALLSMAPPGAPAAPADHFVTVWKTDNAGPSSSTSITIPMVGGPYDVDWDGDMTFDETGLAGAATHDYGVVGTYTVRIRGSYDGIRFADSGDRLKIINVSQWGTNAWTIVYQAFEGCSNLAVTATDVPNFSNVTNMMAMFRRAEKANPDVSQWNTSNVTVMDAMFWEASAANPDVSQWDTSNVGTMSYMFYGSSANPDVSQWDTSSVIDMSSMFRNASNATPDVSQWNTSNVTDMSYMFDGATSANPDVSQWDTSSVTNMASMFYGATSANPDVSQWDTSNVVDMIGMFSNATSANPDVSQWNVASMTDAGVMFNGSGLSAANYDALLVNWSAQAVHSGVVFGAVGVYHCSRAAAAGRDILTETYGWTITDAGQCPPTPTPTPTLAVPLAAAGSLSLLLALFGVALLAALALRRAAETP